MASTFPEDFNPFEAPATPSAGAAPVDPAGTSIELTRRRYQKHEASVRSVGALAYLGAFAAAIVLAFGLVGVVAMMVATQPPRKFPVDPRFLFGITSVVALAIGMLYGTLGYGLRRLRPWARWTSVTLAGLYLLLVVANFAWVAAINPQLAGDQTGRSWLPIVVAGLVLYLMLSAKGAFVFSADYREVVRQTPHLRYKTSLIVKVFLALLIAIIPLAVLVGTVEAMRGWR